MKIIARTKKNDYYHIYYICDGKMTINLKDIIEVNKIKKVTLFKNKFSEHDYIETHKKIMNDFEKKIKVNYKKFKLIKILNSKFEWEFYNDSEKSVSFLEKKFLHIVNNYTDIEMLTIKGKNNYVDMKFLSNVTSFSNLKYIEIENIHGPIPEEIFMLEKLDTLILNNTKIEQIPSNVQLKNLCKLEINDISLTHLPDNIFNHKLKIISLHTSIINLSENIGGCLDLENIIIKSKNLEAFPSKISNWNNLKRMTIVSNKLKKLPNEVTKLNLEYLDIRLCKNLDWYEVINNFSYNKNYGCYISY